MNLKVGDPVIVSSYFVTQNIANHPTHYKNGYIKEIFELDGATAYRVDLKKVDGLVVVIYFHIYPKLLN